MQSKQPRTQRRTNWSPWLLLFLLFGVAGWRVWPSVRTYLQTMAILDLIQNKPVPEILGAFASEPISSEDVQYPTPNGVLHARMYFPLHQPHAPSMLVLHGVHAAGMNEPHLMTFASALAASGLRVLTPDLPDLKEYRVDETTIRNIGESAVWLAQQTHAPVGAIGLSFSGGLALVAATRPAYASSFRFLFVVGAHDNLARVSRFYRTGEVLRPDGTTERLQPHEYGALVMEYNYLADFLSPQNLQPIQTVLKAHLEENSRAEAAAMAKLTPEQQAKAQQLMDSHSPITLQELAMIEKKHAAEMQALSPEGKVANLKVPVYVLHGAGDNIIPSSESLWLARELPRSQLRDILISPVITHVGRNDKNGIGILDQWKLIHFLARVMETAKGT
ncbi:MAG: CocE/NonD family hydrolase [Acidobacteriaceae bacterium]